MTCYVLSVTLNSAHLSPNSITSMLLETCLWPGLQQVLTRNFCQRHVSDKSATCPRLVCDLLIDFQFCRLNQPNLFNLTQFVAKWRTTMMTKSSSAVQHWQLLHACIYEDVKDGKSAITFCRGLVCDLLKACRRPGRRHVLSRFKAGFRQDRYDGIWALAVICSLSLQQRDALD